MKTDYQNLNTFEAALICVIAAGFLIMGVIFFASLTPTQQVNVASAFTIFDIHEEATQTAQTTIGSIVFVAEIPQEFYKEFYIAFTQVATLPSETVEFPIEVASKIYSNVAFTINALADQAQTGYMAQTEFNVAHSELTPSSITGTVSGAVIDLFNR